MTLTIELTPEEEAQLIEQAHLAGLDATEYARRRLIGSEEPASLLEEWGGKMYIRGSSIKVRIIAEEIIAGYSLLKIREAHPHLTLAQVLAALWYYSAHQSAFDAEIAALKQAEEEGRAKSVQPTREELEERARQRGFVRTPDGLRKTG